MTKPGAGDQALRDGSAFGAKVLSSDEPTGSLRAEIPTDAVDKLATLPAIQSVQLDEDIQRFEPTP
jgi:hypothetical protein